MLIPLKLLSVLLATVAGCIGGTLYIFYPTHMGLGLFPIEEVFSNVPVVKATAGLTAASFLAASGALIARRQKPEQRRSIAGRSAALLALIVTLCFLPTRLQTPEFLDYRLYSGVIALALFTGFMADRLVPLLGSQFSVPDAE
jgi:hypothetical protein